MDMRENKLLLEPIDTPLLLFGIIFSDSYGSQEDYSHGKQYKLFYFSFKFVTVLPLADFSVRFL